MSDDSYFHSEKGHPSYPVIRGHPPMDRCKCGGVRHWHAVAPNGCDDCECTEFTLNEDWRAPAEPLRATGPHAIISALEKAFKEAWQCINSYEDGDDAKTWWEGHAAGIQFADDLITPLLEPGGEKLIYNEPTNQQGDNHDNQDTLRELRLGSQSPAPTDTDEVRNGVSPQPEATRVRDVVDVAREGLQGARDDSVAILAEPITPPNEDFISREAAIEALADELLRWEKLPKRAKIDVSELLELIRTLPAAPLPEPATSKMEWALEDDTYTSGRWAVWRVRDSFEDEEGRWIFGVQTVEGHLVLRDDLGTFAEGTILARRFQAALDDKDLFGFDSAAPLPEPRLTKEWLNQMFRDFWARDEQLIGPGTDHPSWVNGYATCGKSLIDAILASPVESLPQEMK